MYTVHGQRDNVYYRDYLILYHEYYLKVRQTVFELEQLIEGQELSKIVLGVKADGYYKTTRKGFREYSAMVVFLALALESYNYDLGVELFGEREMKKTEKMPISQKWTKVFVRLSGDENNKYGHVDKIMSKLIATRRMLVHSKSELHYFPENSDEANEALSKIKMEGDSMISIDESAELINEIAKVMKEYANETGEYIPYMLNINDIDSIDSIS